MHFSFEYNMERGDRSIRSLMRCRFWKQPVGQIDAALSQSWGDGI
jgi:hypothetical protein